MKPGFKKALAILCVMAAAAVFAVAASAAGKVVDTGKCGEKATWTLYEDGLLEISGEGDMYDYVWWRGTNGIQGDTPPPWYKYNGNGLKSLVIKEGITTIGSCAFSQCDSIKGSLVIPDSVTVIAGNAFSDCTGFDGTLDLGSGVKIIGRKPAKAKAGSTGGWVNADDAGTPHYNAFKNCSGFTGDLIIPDNVEELFVNSFRGCSGFNGKLYISKNLKSWKHDEFSGCTGLTGELIIPGGVAVIPENVFKGCTGFTGRLHIPDTITLIEDEAFSGCTGFTGELILPTSVKTIMSRAFEGCSGITGVTLPEGYVGLTQHSSSGNTVIAVPYAFQNCTSLKSVTIPASMTVVSRYAFWKCPDLTTVVFNGDAPKLSESPFDAPRDTLTFYYKEGTSGWTTPTWNGYRCYPIGTKVSEDTSSTEVKKPAGQPSGQVIGQVLSTDIRAYINGAEIPAYNIDGKLAIVVSDLNNYGFKTQYNNDQRKSSVTRNPSAKNFQSVPSKSDGLPIGTPVMSVFSSDITVELDGRAVQAFNVDNRMAIYFTELKSYGTYVYDNNSRTSSLTLK